MKSFRSVLFALAWLLMVLPGNAHAQFFEPPVIRGESAEYRFAAAGDLNGDGKADLVALRTATPSVWEIRINQGDGTFVTTSPLDAVGLNTTPTIADVDGDGHADIIVQASTAAPGSVPIRVFWGDGTGTFASFTDLFGSVPSSIAVGNLNGDNYPDLAISHRTSPTGVTVRYGRGNRQFDAPLAIAEVPFASQVAMANIDGDSSPDLLVLVTPPVSLGDPSLRVLPGAAGLVYDGRAFTMGGATSVAMAAADLDGDGVSEAVVTMRGLTPLVIRYSGGLPSPEFLGGVAVAAVPAAVTDVDGDGRVDIVAADVSNTAAAVLLGQDDGSFSQRPAFPIASVAPRWTMFRDLNGDGALDVLAGGGLITVGTSSEIAVTLHVPPLRIGAAGVAAPVGSDGMASVVLDAGVDSGHSDVSFSWFSPNGDPLGTGARLVLSLPVGIHPFTVRASTPVGLKAVTTAVVTVSPPPPPASETSVQAIQTTLDNKLDVAVSSRASQESLTQTHAALMSLGTLVQAQLDVPVSSRASVADVAAIGSKVDQLQTLLPTSASLNAITQAVNTMGASLASTQMRLAIESALARGERIASFYLPAAQGGHLDLVRSIVIETADKNEAAGGNALTIAKARRSIAEADARKAAGDYRTAYILYSAAYQILGA